MAVAIGIRQLSNSSAWRITTSSHWGTMRRLAPRNSGTSVWTASSWPGSRMLAYTMAGTITGRPCSSCAAARRPSSSRKASMPGEQACSP
jgi:hypothetical protein